MCQQVPDVSYAMFNYSEKCAMLCYLVSLWVPLCVFLDTFKQLFDSSLKLAIQMNRVLCVLIMRAITGVLL